MNSISNTVTPGNAPQGDDVQYNKVLRHATRFTALMAVVSAVMLPLLPSLTKASGSPHQQLAQAAVDRVAAGGGMLWLDDDESSSSSTAE